MTWDAQLGDSVLAGRLALAFIVLSFAACIAYFVYVMVLDYREMRDEERWQRERGEGGYDGL
jgi:hypothetical protein